MEYTINIEDKYIPFLDELSGTIEITLFIKNIIEAKARELIRGRYSKIAENLGETDKINVISTAELPLDIFAQKINLELEK